MLPGTMRLPAILAHAPDELIGFGVALPGLIDHIGATVLYSIELGWQNVSLHALFHERFGDHIYLGNL